MEIQRVLQEDLGAVFQEKRHFVNVLGRVAVAFEPVLVDALFDAALAVPSQSSQPHFCYFRITFFVEHRLFE